MATGIGQYTPIFLPRELPSLIERPGRSQATGSQGVEHYLSDPVCTDSRLLFFPCGSSDPVRLNMKVVQQLNLQGPWCRQACRDMHCLCHRSYGLIRGFCQASCNWQVEGQFVQSFSIAPPIQALRGLPCLGSFSVWRVRPIKGPPAGVLLCKSVHLALKGAPWVGSCSVAQCVRNLMAHPLYCSAASAGMWGEAVLMAPPLHVTQQYRLASIAAQLSSTSISHHSLLPYIPSICLSAVNAVLTLGLLHNP